MRRSRTLGAALGLAVALIGTACGPGPSGPSTTPWRPFTVGNGLVEGNAPAIAGATSGDGTVFAFTSNASNLVPGDTNNLADLFVRDEVAGTTTRIVTGVSGGTAISADGRFVSIDGDAKVYDRQTSTLIDLGVTAVGTEGEPWVSSSGTEAVFGLGGSIIGPSGMTCWIRPLNLGPAAKCNPDPSVNTGFLSASADLDRIVVQIAPLAGLPYVALIDRSAGTLTPVTGATASFGRVPISPNGRYVAWPAQLSTSAPFPTTIMVFDAQTGLVSTFTPATAPDGMTLPQAISDDGHSVLALSQATNLVAGDTNAVPDVFRIDVSANTAVRVSLTQAGVQLLSQSYTMGHPSATDSTFTHVALCATDPLSALDTNGQPDCTLVSF